MVADFTVEELTPGSNVYRVYVKTTEQDDEVLITDVGFGVSQVLPVLALINYVPEGSVVVLEQPEIHLHPRVQSELADAIIDAVKKRRIQVLFESHSEHLLRRLQLRVAEGRIGSDDVRLYFTRRDRPAASIDALELDAFGNIWRRAPQASLRCRQSCADFLEDVRGARQVLVHPSIHREYGRQLDASGPPLQGDAFFEWLVQNQSNPRVCAYADFRVACRPPWVDPYPTSDCFSTFDPSDRKFVAASIAASCQASIVNACDSDWDIVAPCLAHEGIGYVDLCPDCGSAK